MPKADVLESLVKAPRVIDGFLVYDEAVPVAAFKIVSGLNPATADSQAVELAIGRLRAALDGLKPGEKAQVVVDCRRYNPKTDILSMNSKISEEATPGFQTYYPKFVENYLTDYCSQTLSPEFHYTILFGYTEPPSAIPGPEKSLKDRLAEVERRSTAFANTLRTDGIEAKMLTTGELVDLVDEALNPSRIAPLAESTYSAAPDDSGFTPGKAELFLRSPINQNPRTDRRYSYLQVGGSYVKSLGFNGVPTTRVSDAMVELLLCQREFRFSFYVGGMSDRETAKIIEVKRKEAAGAVQFAGGKGTQASEEQASEWDGLLRLQARREVRFCRWSGYLTVFAESEQDLAEAAADLGTAFADMVPDEGIYRQADYWVSALPLFQDRAAAVMLAPTDAVSRLFPFFNFRTSSPGGGALLGFSPANEPCFYDPWAGETLNGNVFVTGMPGSGKSFLINILLARLGPLALDVSIIDKAESYRTMCACLGGDYIQFSSSGETAVNIFDVLDYDKELEDAKLNDLTQDGKVRGDKIDLVVGLLEIIVGEEGKENTLERSLLVEDVQATYERKLKLKDGKVDPESVPTLADLAEILRQKIDKPSGGQEERYVPNRRDILQKLGSALTGVYAGLVNSKTTLKSNGRVRVFDISKISEGQTMQSVAVYLITSWCDRHWRRNKAKHVRQACVIDEMAFFMPYEAGRRLLENLARRSRHLGLYPCMFATQQFTDVLPYKETRAIMEGSPTRFLFKQDKNVIDNVAGILGLSDTERGALQGLNQVPNVYSTVYFARGSKRNILTIRPDAAVRWMATTESNFDVPRRAEVMKSVGGDPWAAVQTLVEQGG